MADNSDIAALELQSDALGDSLGDAAGMAASFESELRRVRDAFEATGKDVETLEKGLSKGLRRAFEQVVFDGDSLSSTL
jgi:hypothetical protein